MHQPIDVLGAMIAPAVLISAAALLLLSTANRLGRVNDRLHHLMTEAERRLSQGSPTSMREQKQLLNLEQLTSLQQRLPRLRSAVTALYVTIALLVVTSIVGGMYVLFPQLTSIVPISLGMLGATAFLCSIALLLSEASIAACVTLKEIAYARELLEQQDGQAQP
jgi:Protein of unknown function (DUF2721)